MGTEEVALIELLFHQLLEACKQLMFIVVAQRCHPQLHTFILIESKVTQPNNDYLSKLRVNCCPVFIHFSRIDLIISP